MHSYFIAPTIKLWLLAFFALGFRLLLWALLGPAPHDAPDMIVFLVFFVATVWTVVCLALSIGPEP